MLEQCLRILRSKDLCVLATSGSAGAHCSLMAYVADPQGRTVFLATLKDTLKYANIRHDPRVSLLLDTRDEQQDRVGRSELQALTLSCFATELTGAQAQTARTLLAGAHPQLSGILESDNAALLALRVLVYQLLTGPTQSFRHMVV